MKFKILIAGLLLVTVTSVEAEAESGWPGCIDACKVGFDACNSQKVVVAACGDRYQACLDRCDDLYRNDPESQDYPIIPKDKMRLRKF